ncbi:MAG: serine hydrolase domain-containing protein [Bacteroidota bacterium]
MKYKIRTSILFVLLTLAISTNAQEKLTNSVRSEVESLAAAFLLQTNTPGLSIAVSKNGNIIYAEGFGYANIEKSIAMDTTTRLRTASVAKVITATALGRLASEGKLDFDAPIHQYVPYINKDYAHLTTRQLAGHTAGLPHRPRGARYKKKQYDAIKETVGLMEAPLLFEPDTDYKYSTHAYNLLAAVIEGTSGKAFLDYMNNAIFKPLGMTHTGAEHIKKLTKKDAQIYYVKNGKPRLEKITNPSYKIPGAGFRTTPSDLVKMMEAYSNGFISKKVVEEMFSSHHLKNGTKTNVGIAWRSSFDPFDNRVIEHAGSWRGARTVIVHYPNQNLNISLMVNANCQVLIEETAHIFAEVIRNGKIKGTTIKIPNEAVRVTYNSEKGKEVYDGTLALNGKNGHLHTKSDGFLKSNPIHYLGTEQNYILSTKHGFIYMDLDVSNALFGQLFIYSNRLPHNPKKETPMVTFKNK